MSTTPQHSSDERTISLDEVQRFIRQNKKTIAFYSVVALLIGILYASVQQNEYACSVRVMPELKTSSATGGLNDLKSLAGLAGVNLDNINSGSEAIRPDLYPDIVQSTPFSIYLLNRKVRRSDNPANQTVQQFLEDYNARTTVGWLMGMLGSNKDIDQVHASTTGNINLTKEQEKISQEVLERVNTTFDKKSGIVTISATMPDPLVASTVAGQTLDYLTKYVTTYRTGKSRQQVNFLFNQVSNAKARYEKAEYAVSSYRDRNKSLYLNTAKIEEQRLQAEYLLAQTVYTELSKQLEQARIKMQEEVPVFQLLEPPRVPTRKSAPQRSIIVLSFLIAGTVIGVIAAFLRNLSDSSR